MVTGKRGIQSRFCPSNRILELAQHKTSKTVWATTPCEPLRPISASALVAVPSARIQYLARNKRDFSAWDDQWRKEEANSFRKALDPSSKASQYEHIVRLSTPKNRSRSSQEAGPPHTPLCESNCSIWHVDPKVKTAMITPRLLQLSKPKRNHPDFQSNRDSATSITYGVSKTVRISPRLVRLSLPKLKESKLCYELGHPEEPIWTENVPPRPPLPKSYYPLEPSPTFPPSIPPLPLNSTTWLHSLAIDDDYLDGEESYIRKSKFGEQKNSRDLQEQVQERQSNMNKVGIVPPRTKSPIDGPHSSSVAPSRHNGRIPNGISRERPKSAVFPAEVKSKMSVEEQNERIRRNQSSSVRDKRRSLNLSSGQTPANYKVVRRRLTAHEVDIKDLEAAVRGEGLESPREEIARLRRLQIQAEPRELDINRELMAPDKVVIPERHLDVENSAPLSPEEQKEKQKKVERIKTLIAKSNLQNVVPLLDGPVEGGGPVSSQQQLQEQEKRIEISCVLAAEASRRSRLLSAQCTPSPPTSLTSLAPPPSSADFSNSAHIMKV